MSKQTKIILDNEVEIPMFGLGIFKMPEGKVIIRSVRKALELGYCHIDIVAYYKNEKGVGEGMR